MKTQLFLTAVVSVVVVLGAAVPAPVRAALLNASNILGETTDTGAPLYTNGDFNNGKNSVGVNQPEGVAIDTTGHRMFVADGCRVLVFNLSSRTNNLNDYVADNVLGQTNFRGDEGCRMGQNGFYGVRGLAYDSANQRLFVGDSYRVMIFNLAGGITNGMNAANVLGNGGTFGALIDQPCQPARQDNFCNIYDVSYDPVNHRLFVTDVQYSRVLVFDLSGGITNGENPVHVLGRSSFTDMPGGTTYYYTTQNQLIMPYSAYPDPTGQRLFVADHNNSRVLVYNLADGIIDGENAINVLGQPDFTGRAYGATQHTMNFPESVVVSPDGMQLFVADAGAHRVLVYDLTTGIANGENAINVLGQPDFVSGDFATTQNGLRSPAHLAHDGTRLYVTEVENNRVTIFTTTTITNGQNAVNEAGQLTDAGGVLYTVDIPDNGPGTRGMSVATDTVIDAVSHHMFVVDSGNNRVLSYNLTNANAVTDRTADNVLGQSGYRADANGLSAATMNEPQGIALDVANHRLFVADTQNSRVLVYNVNTIANGENAINVIGQANFTGGDPNRGGAVAANTLSYPTRLAYDPSGQRLFVADAGNSRVLVYDVNTIANGENAINVIGQANFTGGDPNRGGAIAANTLSYPNGLAVSSGQRLFVVDTQNNRTLVYNLADGITNGENAVNVLGQADFVSGDTNRGGTLAANTLNNPVGLTYDAPNQRLFISDSYNKRVVGYNLAVIANGEDATSVIGQTGFTTFDENGGLPSQTNFSTPSGLWYDSGSNQLAVADESFNRVLIFGTGAIPLAPLLAIGALDAAPLALSADATSTAQYDLVLSQQPVASVGIDILEIDPNNVVRVRDHVAFTKKNWNTPKKVAIRVRRKAEIDGSATITLQHVASSDDPVFNAIAIPDVVVTVTE